VAKSWLELAATLTWGFSEQGGLLNRIFPTGQWSLVSSINRRSSGESALGAHGGRLADTTTKNYRGVLG